jgi:hypothetical protein
MLPNELITNCSCCFYEIVLVLQTAAALNDQTRQLNKIVDDLADIEFNVKKATKVIGNITRGLLTDK